MNTNYDISVFLSFRDLEEELKKLVEFPTTFLYNGAPREEFKGGDVLESFSMNIDFSELECSYIHEASLFYTKTKESWVGVRSIGGTGKLMKSTTWQLSVSVTSKAGKSLHPWEPKRNIQNIINPDPSRVLDCVYQGVLSVAFLCLILLNPNSNLLRDLNHRITQPINDLFITKEEISSPSLGPNILRVSSLGKSGGDLMFSTFDLFLQTASDDLHKLVGIFGAYFNNNTLVFVTTVDEKEDHKTYRIKFSSFKEILTRILNRDEELMRCWDDFASYLIQRFV